MLKVGDRYINCLLKQIRLSAIADKEDRLVKKII